ncbi:MAG: L,D-transpeptidase [Verrucomicrobia bacterium]|nr:L,D-transpeptidase [Verrucomicrobiota bacterium]
MMRKIFLFGAVGLFTAIGIAAAVKKGKTPLPQVAAPAPEIATSKPLTNQGDFPGYDRMSQIFSTKGPTLPIVETVTYTSRVNWLKGRPAWIADYAVYYGTSRHFIARSLSGKHDYMTQRVSEGSKFNVFRKDKHFQFYLLADLSLCKMGFYYIDTDTGERVLLKTYRIGVGKPSTAVSGSLTPLGKFTLGDKIAVYAPGITNKYQNRDVEMVRIFGTRWLPFDRGYGIHGAPWINDPQTGELVENRATIGKYESDGCIRLTTEDMEELFSIVITRPTTVEIVKNFKEAQLPGVEK